MLLVHRCAAIHQAVLQVKPQSKQKHKLTSKLGPVGQRRHHSELLDQALRHVVTVH
jgi:hypothetical protein